MIRLLKIFQILVASTLLGCSVSDYTGEPQYVLYIQDAPADYRSVRTSIASVEIYGGGSWHTLDSDRSFFNLLDLTGGEMFKVAWADLPAGNYTELKVSFSSNMQINDGGVSASVEVKTPELLLPINANLASDEQWIDIVDVDVAQSISESLSGEQTLYSFAPKARVVDLGTMGVVNMAVVNQDGGSIGTGALIVATNEKTSEIFSTYINEVTSLAVLKLPAGFYTLSVELPEDASYFPTTLTNVEVAASGYVNLDPVRLEQIP